MRQVVGLTGAALFYLATVFAMVVMARFFQRVRHRDVRVTETQGLLVLVLAMGLLGLGLTGISLSAALVPLGLGMIVLGAVIAAYGAEFLRRRR